MRDNVVSKLLFVVGIALMAVGLLTGVIIAAFGFRYGLNLANGMMWSVLFTYFFAGLVLGLLFIGLSEIVNLLHNLNDKLTLQEEEDMKVYPTAKTEQPIEKTWTDNRTEDISANDPQSNNEWTPTQADKTRIMDYFGDQEILEIIPSNQESYCLVKMRGEYGRAFVRVVDVQGSSIAEVSDPELKKQIIAWYNRTESE